jgi:hypothetical protein
MIAWQENCLCGQRWWTLSSPLRRAKLGKVALIVPPEPWEKDYSWSLWRGWESLHIRGKLLAGGWLQSLETAQEFAEDALFHE